MVDYSLLVKLSLFILILGLNFLIALLLEKLYYELLSRFLQPTLELISIRYYRAGPRLKLIILIVFSLFMTALLIKAYPIVLEADKLVTVFAGVFGSMCAAFGLYEMLRR